MSGSFSISEELLARYSSEQKKHGLLPVKVSDFYRAKVEEETLQLGHGNGPLTRIAYPNADKLSLHVGDEFADWGCDLENMVEGLDGMLIRKYEERVLLLVTDACFSNCQYCFRQDILSNGGKVKKSLTSKDLNKLVAYLKANPVIREVVLSGGDPMTLSAQALRTLVGLISQEAQVRSIRLHTRSLVYAPDAITTDKIDLLAQYGVRVVFHISHPYEICGVVEAKIREMRAKGIRLYNQFPLLRGINDHHEVLIEHLTKLDELGIRNLSVFFPDPVKFSASYRIPVSRLRKIIQQFNWNSPSWVNSTRFLIYSNIGKIRLEDVVSQDPARHELVFARQGNTITYRDFPERLDVPGDLDTMLWKRHQ